MAKREASPRKQVLYELQLNVSKLQISTKFPCAFYLSVSHGRNDLAKADELARIENGIVCFQQPLMLRLRVDQTSRGREVEPRRVQNC